MSDLSNVKVTAEFMKKAQGCESADELLKFAKENGIELTKEEAEECFKEMSRELTEEELEMAAGGTVGICDDLCRPRRSTDTLDEPLGRRCRSRNQEPKTASDEDVVICRFRPRLNDACYDL